MCIPGAQGWGGASKCTLWTLHTNLNKWDLTKVSPSQLAATALRAPVGGRRSASSATGLS